jgi:AcrR family transcriptional regulator
MPKGIPLTEEELSDRRVEIAEAAMHLFSEKGFNETSMREIGEAAGAGKSTLYDYFPSKEEILIFFAVEEVRQLAGLAAEILTQELSAAEKLRRILHKQMEYLVANKLLYLKLSFETQRLSFESQQRLQLHRHAYQDMLCSLLQEGIHNGEFRPVNPLLAVRGMFSLLTSTIFTTRPTGTPEEMLLETFDILFKGLEVR